MNPELYERYLAKKAKKLGISVEELKSQSAPTLPSPVGSVFADERSSDSERFEHTVAKPQMRNTLSMEQIQDRVSVGQEGGISDVQRTEGQEDMLDESGKLKVESGKFDDFQTKMDSSQFTVHSSHDTILSPYSSIALSPSIKDNRENKFGLIGYPLGHSLSKIIHEAGFKSLGINATYDILETPPDSLIDRIKFLKNNGYKGFNVTIPLKLPVSLFINEVDKYADLARAINTVYIAEDKSLKGYNTDVIGFKKAIPSDIYLRGKQIGILGTGGAAHAACVALSEMGVKTIDFFTRNIPNSIDLMNYFRRIFPSINFNVYQIENIRNLTEYSMLVNTTPIGMLGKSGDMTPVEETALRTLNPGAVVYDVIYNPKKTVLIKLAEKLGLRTITGLDMLVYQALAAQQIWLGGVPDFKDMKISALEAL